MGENIKQSDNPEENNDLLKGLLQRKCIGISKQKSNGKRGTEHVVKKRLKNFFLQKFMTKRRDECV